MLKEINETDYVLKDMRWNKNSEVDNVTRVKVRLINATMIKTNISYKQTWCASKGMKWRVNNMNPIMMHITDTTMHITDTTMRDAHHWQHYLKKDPRLTPKNIGQSYYFPIYLS